MGFFFEEQAVENYEVGRILLEHKHIYRIICNDGEYVAELSGKFRHEALTKEIIRQLGIGYI